MWKDSDFDLVNNRVLGYAKDEMQTLLQDWTRCIRRYRNYRILLCSVLSVCVFLLGILEYSYLYNRIPARINIRAGQEETIDLGLPVKGELLTVGSSGESNIPEGAVTIDFSKPVTLKSDGLTEYLLEIKLFGIFTMKEVGIQVIQEQEIIPVGEPIGLYMETQGVLVVGVGEFTDAGGTKISPSKSVLKSGDYIQAVNGQEVADKRQIVDMVAQCEGETMEFDIMRQGELVQVSVTPRQDNAGEYKIGVWLRDNTQGVGTLTYVDGSGNYGALGHSIADVDTGRALVLDSGTLYRAKIVGVEKGVIGEPGEITGYISYTDKDMLGTIEVNCDAGVYGTLYDKAKPYFAGDAMPIGFKQEIKKGEAQILTTIGEKTDYYDIRITGLKYDSSSVNRGIEIEVTDEELLALTGGIVQGMSGSPIIQNGRIVGAVTHVLVNDPTRGYGIFIENMLEH